MAVNVWPGWHTVPFLTEATRHVLTAVNFALVVALITSLVLAVYETSSLTAFGKLVMLGFSGAALVRLWQVFPLDFGDSAFDWALVARVFLIAGLVGTSIGIIVNFVAVLRQTPEG